MSVKRLSELDEISSLATTDLLDTSKSNGDTTYTSKKITFANVASSVVAQHPETITSTIGLNIYCEDNGVISVGLKPNYIVMPYACTIKSWRIIGNTIGNIVIDVWKKANAVPTIADTITGTEKPTLSSQQINQDTNLTTWNTAVAVGDVIAFNVDSVSGLGSITLILGVEKI